MRIALDAMGGDRAPAAMVEGAVRYARASGDAVLLVGDARAVQAELSRLGEKAGDRLEVVHASEVVDMGESPGQAIRKKRDSSMRVGFDLVAKGKADAVLSAGNSGAMMAGAIFLLGRLPGVERPGIATALPTVKGHTVLIDAGANPDCRPIHLCQFAALGEVYARVVLGQARPRVGLLANGEEETKGTDLTRETHAALKKSGLDFAGYVEGKDLFTGDIAVMVTDGFTGNAVLKTAEGAAKVIAEILRSEIERGVARRLGGLLLRPAFEALRRRVDYASVGGAPLLGVDGVTMVAHGRSTAKAMASALATASAMARADRERELRRELAAAVAKAGGWLDVRDAGAQGERPHPPQVQGKEA